ncbi:PTS sugar transporter subunit IIA [Candidatus Auribacterota bacterium]
MKAIIDKIISPIRDFIFGKKQKKVAPVKSLGESAVKLANFLSSETIVIHEGAIDKKSCIRLLSEKLCAAYGIDDLDGVVGAIMNREKLESTFLDNEVAIPHARYEGVSEIKAVLGIFPGGVIEEESEKLPANFVFLFLSPVNALTQHLQLLTRIAFVFQDALVKSSLLKIKSTEDIHKLLKEKEGMV